MATHEAIRGSAHTGLQLSFLAFTSRLTVKPPGSTSRSVHLTCKIDKIFRTTLIEHPGAHGLAALLALNPHRLPVARVACVLHPTRFRGSPRLR